MRSTAHQAIKSSPNTMRGFLQTKGWDKGHQAHANETKAVFTVRKMPAVDETSFARGMNESNDVRITIPRTGLPA